MAISIWVKPSSRSEKFVRVIGKGNELGNTREYGIWIDPEGYPLAQSFNYIKYMSCDGRKENKNNRGCGEVVNVWNTKGKKVELNKWTNLVYVYNNRTLSLYMDGDLVDSKPHNGVGTFSIEEPLTLGGDRVDGHASFKGLLNDCNPSLKPYPHPCWSYSSKPAS